MSIRIYHILKSTTTRQTVGHIVTRRVNPMLPLEVRKAFKCISLKSLYYIQRIKNNVHKKLFILEILVVIQRK